MATMNCDPVLLFKKYNVLLVEIRSLENSLDDQTVPYFEQEFKLTRFRELTEAKNETIKLIKEAGYDVSKEELLNGFEG